jgi:hypothetical protein
MTSQGRARALHALIAARGVAPPANEVGNQDKEDGAGQGTAHHTGNHIAERKLKKVKHLLTATKIKKKLRS